MTDQDVIFLTRSEAVAAIRIDFEQYGFQFHLLQSLFPLVTENRMVLAEDGDKNCFLIKRGKKSKTLSLDNDDVIHYLVRLLENAALSMELMARVCAIVFEAEVVSESHPDTGETGILLETGMDRFVCRRCGHCCTDIVYRDGCTTEDYHRWISGGRTDILARVMVLSSGDGSVTYRIWKDPSTGGFHQRCPWLEALADRDGWRCAIEEVKPDICRQYPYTRKHAAMTGCKGVFNTGA